MIIHCGALASSSNGVFCIDELERVNWKCRGGLREVLDLQSLTISKCGVVSSLCVRTAVMGSIRLAARKRGGVASGQRKERLVKPGAIKQRFDLVYRLVDRFDVLRDVQLSRHFF